MIAPIVLAHWSDTHYGERTEELVTVMDWIAADLAPRKPDLQLMTGDLYEGGTTPALRNVAMDGVAKQAAISALLIIRGNHDPDGEILKFGRMAARHPILALEHPAVVYFAGGRFHREPVAGGIIVCALPWMTRAGLVRSLGRVATDIEEINALAAEGLDLVLATFQRAIAAYDGPAVVASHADCIGRKRSIGNPDVGVEVEIDPLRLASLGASYVALGHEHARQEVAGGCWYAGAPRRVKHGEAEDKGYNLVTIGEDRVATVEFCKTPCAPMLSLDATWTGAELLPEKGDWDAAQSPERLARAKVRLVYEVTEDQRPAAQAQAQLIKENILRLVPGDDRPTVRIQPKSKLVHRVRAPAIVHARSLHEKLQLFLLATNQLPDETRMNRLDRLLAEEADKLGMGTGIVHGAIDIHGFRFRGFRMFKEEVSVKLDDIPGKLLVVRGDNGSGKSTLINLAGPGTLYRSLPDVKEDLVAWARARDAFTEVDASIGGVRHLFRVDVDAGQRESVAYIRLANGEPVDGVKGGPAQYDRWVKEHLPSKDLFLASRFATQGHLMSPVKATTGELKGMLCELLGFGYLAKVAAAFVERIRPKKKPELGMELLVERLTGECKALAGADEQLAAARDEAARIEEVVTAALARLQREEEAERVATAVERRWAEARPALVVAAERAADRAASGAAEIGAAKRAVDDTAERLRGAGDRVAVAQKTIAEVGDAGALLAALPVAEACELQGRATVESSAAGHVARQAEAVASRAKLAKLVDLLAEREKQAVSAKAQLDAATSTVAGGASVGADLARAIDAVERLATADARLAAARDAQKAVEGRVGGSVEEDRRRERIVAELTTKRGLLEQEQRTVVDSAKLLDTVPCHAEGDYAACGFLARGVAARDRLPTLRELLAATVRSLETSAGAAYPDGYVALAERDGLVRAAAAEVEYLQAERDAVAPMAGRVGDLERAAAALETARATLTERTAVVADLAQRIDKGRGLAATARAEEAAAMAAEVAAGEALAAARVAHDAVREELEALRRRAARVEHLPRVEKELADATAEAMRLEGMLVAARATAETQTAALAQFETDAQAARQALVDHDAGRPSAVDGAVVRGARAAHGSAERDRAVAVARVADAEKQSMRLADATVELAQASELLGDLRLLALAFGPKGIPALEIDAAAPAVSDLINTLLAECWGDRFTVEVRTLSKTVDGEKEIEGAFIHVIDGEADDGNGIQGEARKILSDGLQVIVDEAIRLAAAIHSAREAGGSGGTLVRDEAEAALKPENRLRYVRMLRKAATLGDFSKIIYVSHDEGAQSLADAVLEVLPGGKVVITLPGGERAAA